jgi:hypothetical protein
MYSSIEKILTYEWQNLSTTTSEPHVGCLHDTVMVNAQVILSSVWICKNGELVKDRPMLILQNYLVCILYFLFHYPPEPGWSKIG